MIFRKAPFFTGSSRKSPSKRRFLESVDGLWNGLTPKNDLSDRNPSSPLPRSVPDRLRWDGRDPAGRGFGARPDRGDQGSRRAVRAGPVAPATVHARGAGRGSAFGRPEHRHDLRRRRMARTPVHRHGVRGRRVARGPPARRPPFHGRSARLARAGGRGARRSACEGRRPSRREAREPAPDQRRCSTRRRLRDRERRGPAVADDHRDRPRYRRLPLAGAGARGKGDAGQRSVRPCGGRVRAPDRKLVRSSRRARPRRRRLTCRQRFRRFRLSSTRCSSAGWPRIRRSGSRRPPRS